MDDQQASSLLVFQTRSSEPVASGAPWLISFGDLLTLLLCLFLAIVSFSPLAKSAKGTQTPGSTNTLRKPEQLARTGTWFADSRVGVLSFELGLKEQELSNNSLGSYQKSLIEFKDAVTRAGYTFGEVMIESCSAQDGVGAWDLAQARAQVLARQVFDVGFNFHSIKTRVLGPACAALINTKADNRPGLEELSPLGARIQFSVTRTDG